MMSADVITIFNEALQNASNQQHPSRWMFDFIGPYLLSTSDYEHPLYQSLLHLLNEKMGVEHAAKIMLFSLHWTLSKTHINSSIIKTPYLLLLYMILYIDDYDALEKETIKKMVKTISELDVSEAATMGWTIMQIGQILHNTESLPLMLQSEEEYKKAHQKTPLIIAVAPFIADIQFLTKWMPMCSGEHIGDRALKNHTHLQSPEAKMSIINLKFQPISQLGKTLKNHWVHALMIDFEQKLNF